MCKSFDLEELKNCSPRYPAFAKNQILTTGLKSSMSTNWISILFCSKLVRTELQLLNHGAGVLTLWPLHSIQFCCSRPDYIKYYLIASQNAATGHDLHVPLKCVKKNPATNPSPKKKTCQEHPIVLMWLTLN